MSERDGIFLRDRGSRGDYTSRSSGQARSKEGDVKRVGNGSGFRADSGSNRYVERNLRGGDHGYFGKVSDDDSGTKRGIFVVFVRGTSETDREVKATDFKRVVRVATKEKVGELRGSGYYGTWSEGNSIDGRLPAWDKRPISSARDTVQGQGPVTAMRRIPRRGRSESGNLSEIFVTGMAGINPNDIVERDDIERCFHCGDLRLKGREV